MAELSSRQSNITNAGFDSPKNCSNWSFLPIIDILRRKLFNKEQINLQTVAEQTWEISPGNTFITRPAVFLPNQLERVTGWAFASEHPRTAMAGGIKVTHAPSRGFLLKNAFLIDNVLYKHDACSYLYPRTKRWPIQLQIENEISRGASYSTEAGGKYFAHWLMDDCITYPLAASEGLPITTNQIPSLHTPDYEKLLNMSPTRLQSAFFKELVIFDDIGNNPYKHERFLQMRDKLLSNKEAQAHPGVFILRGSSGDKRLLKNEIELAELLRDKRGFRILDITKADVKTIIETCAGSQVVIGVEGSQLIHGIQLLPPGGAILTLQPQDRFVHTYKAKADRDHQHFGFVVGITKGDGYHIDPSEIEHTLDLFPKITS